MALSPSEVTAIVFEGSRDEISASGSGPRGDNSQRASAAHADLRRMGMPKVNTLILGDDDTVCRLLGLQLSLGTPIVTWEPGQPLDLPAVACARTLVLRDVDRLSAPDQIRLLSWLDRSVGRTQVLSTARGSILPLLEDGAFLNTLYYRLNTICIDLTN